MHRTLIDPSVWKLFGLKCRRTSENPLIPWSILGLTEFLILRIVTGIRFRKVNRIIYLQIQQGILGPYGAVNPASVSWKSVVNTGGNVHKLDLNSRGIVLSDQKGSKSQVVTGVCLKVLGSRLNLVVSMTDFDFESGVLKGGERESVPPQDRLNLITLDYSDIPTRDVTKKSWINRQSETFIEFTHSGLEADAAQSTIPYLDAQDVETVPAMPLTGVGLYHKAAAGTGGFVGPRVFTYDLTQHFPA